MNHYRLYLALGLLLFATLSGCATTRYAAPRNAKVIDRTVETTGYCKCKKCCNWKRNWFCKAVIASGKYKGHAKKVGITAGGTKAKQGTIAADTKKYPLGTIFYIPGYGYGRVEDRGSAIQGEHLDLFFKSHKQALKWGRQTKRVRVWLAP